uniref:Uncharacterized protein n=1 Tax=Anguilla anguilla TaxID=7936 RepID=A0A0E9PY62_ANGAN
MVAGPVPRFPSICTAALKQREGKSDEFLEERVESI